MLFSSDRIAYLEAVYGLETAEYSISVEFCSIFWFPELRIFIKLKQRIFSRKYVYSWPAGEISLIFTKKTLRRPLGGYNCA